MARRPAGAAASFRYRDLPVVTVRHRETAAIQDAIDRIAADGGGRVVLPGGDIGLVSSGLAEAFDNAGKGWRADTACLILRSGVYLEGDAAGTTLLRARDPDLSCILHVSPDPGGILNLGIDGGWHAPTAAAGHGIFQVQHRFGEHPWCRNALYRGLTIRNVASYGLGLQNGDMSGVAIERVSIRNTGADGIDTKRRGPKRFDGACAMTDVSIAMASQRLPDSAGIDVRGEWHLRRIRVAELGRDGVAVPGVRFRTLGPPPDTSPARSSLVDFAIEGTGRGGAIGVSVGAPQIAISQGRIGRVRIGVQLTGNQRAAARRTEIANVTATGCAAYGFDVSEGCDRSRIGHCRASSCGEAGFRNAALDTVLIGNETRDCATPLSTSAAAARTQRLLGNSFF